VPVSPAIPVAVVGLACRYPDAADPTRLWEVVLGQRRAFRRIPPQRLDLDDYSGPDPDWPDGITTRHAALLEGWEFDRAAHRIPGPVFRAADLTHWLALETAGRALADAGHPDAEGLDRDRVGVVLGNSLTGEFSRAALMRYRWPYVRRMLAETLAEEQLPAEASQRLLDRLRDRYLEPFPEPTDESLAGGLANTIAGRICNTFDLHGGGWTVDGACASSLLAVVTACTELARGAVDLVLAGGVDLSLDPFELVGFSRVGALATDTMRVYDERSAGFWPGEGCGVVALMRAEDAAAQRRRVYAVIDGWGVSSDGHGGLTRPARDGQLLAMHRAYSLAGVDPCSVDLLEGHGTGTAVGDEVELAALARLRAGAASPAVVGSVKANIGHTKAAAGVAGLMKAVLSVYHRVLPPTTGCERPHSLLRAAGVPLRVLAEPQPWPDGPRRAGVNALGFGGINTHVVVTGTDQAGRRRLSPVQRALARPLPDVAVLPLAAPAVPQLRRLLARVVELAPRLSIAEMHDLAHTLAGDPGTGPARAGLQATSPEQLGGRALAALAALDLAPAGRLWLEPGVAVGVGVTGRVALLLPGQGAPIPATGGALGSMDERYAEYLSPAGAGAGPVGAGVVDTAVAQPAVLRASLAALAWLDDLGLVAHRATGHSLGEITGLVWAGCLGEAEAIRLAQARGRAMSENGARGTGMLAVAAEPKMVDKLRAGLDLVVAADNGSRSQVLAGDLAMLRRVVERAAEEGVPAVPLPVSHAFHSPAVAGCVPALRSALAGLRFDPPARWLVSTVLGRRLQAQDGVAELLVTQVTAPVRFREALAEAADGMDLLVEAGPGRTLSALAEPETDVAVVAVEAGSASAAPLAATAAAVFAAGAVDDLSAMVAGRFARPASLQRDPVLLANPCERAPRTAAGAAGGRPRPVPQATPGGSVPVGAAPVGVPAAAGAPNGAGPAAALDVPAAVLALVATATELDPATIQPGQRLLADLHLTSLRVAQLAADAAAATGRARPAAPLLLADATVADLADVVATLPAGEVRQDGDGLAPGVGEWMRCFVDVPVPVDPATLPAALPAARLDLPPAAALNGGATALNGSAAALLGGTGPVPSGGGCLLAYVPEPDAEGEAMRLAAAARTALAGQLPLVVVTHRPGLAGFLRTLHQEHPALGATLLEVPADGAGLRAAADVAGAQAGRFVHARLVGGRWCTEETRPFEPHDSGGSLPLGSDDVVLVTGGARGIGLACAEALGRRTGARLAVLGRGDPAADPALAAGLDRLRATGVRVGYAKADLAAPAATAAAVAVLRAELGPVTAVVHAAGVNRPAPFTALDDAELAAHLAPKAAGLLAVLAGCRPDQPRLVVTFGSTIGRYGLAGESHYALANGTLRSAAERLAELRPDCRVLDIDWSVWSGTGMGERLGAVDALGRLGVTPIRADEGAELLLRLLATPDLPTAVTVHGRLGGLVGRPVVPTARERRFLQHIRAHQPGVEVVADADLAVRDDPYLDDHRIDGLPVLPAVLGLEAMAQAAEAVAGTRLVRVRGLQLDRPVVVPDGGVRRVRVAALSRTGGAVDVVLRSDETDFRVDHFRARFLPAATDAEPPGPVLLPAGLATPPARLGGGELYDRVCFHTGRFRRVAELVDLAAHHCRGRLRRADRTDWFAPGRPAALLLGDPGRNDATIHALQACIPHRRVLPIGCDEVTFSEVDGLEGGSADTELVAVERSEGGGEHVYDVVAHDQAGREVVRWTGLRLREVGVLRGVEPWLPSLLAPYLERTVADLVPGSAVRVAVGPDPAGGTGLTSGTGPAEPTGGPSGVDGDGTVRSRLGQLVLAVRSDRRAGAGWVAVADRPVAGWTEVLGADLLRLAEQVADRLAEQVAAAAARLRAAVECLAEAGRPPTSPLTLAGLYEGGWLRLHAGADAIASVVLRVDGIPEPVAIAVLGGGADGPADV